MKKIYQFLSAHAFLLITLFFIVFIPLYPKLPIVDIQHTWVYIRVEDFLVALAGIFFLIQLLRKKVTLRTPLTLPIVLFWVVGALATLHGIFFLFPKLSGLFPQIAVLHYLRRIEYLFLFFIGFAAIKDKKYATPVIITLAITLLLVCFYGIGQRLWGFPAFLTMNEEFAKGVPLRLSALGRITSTFAGHYDLAAFLTLLIPIMGSMAIGYKKWWAKVFFVLTAASGLVLLLMTASRVSFAVYLLSITFLLIIRKKKLLILPVLVLSILLLQSFQGISQRFASTITQVDLVVDARTGKPIGVAENYSEGKKIVLKNEESTGENLPEGSKYIIPNSEAGAVSAEVYRRSKLGSGAKDQIISRTGEVIVKKAFAYDVSFTTRFQGEWPRAIEAFQRNILLGSGYSSINLATDNNYLRILGEVGLLGFLSFLAIFLLFMIYAAKILPNITNPVIKSFVYGVIAGIFGLMLNAILIDVFEASKVAFVHWLIIGITVGFLHLHQKKPVNFLHEVKRVLFSIPALLIYLALLGTFVFAPSLSNYFVGDDFTWLHWASECMQVTSENAQRCSSLPATIISYFTDAEGFFYRPGTKTYFFLMYPIFELFPATYHFISLALHLSAGVLIFFITRKLLKSKLFAFIASLLFLTLSLHAESIYWISVTGHLVAYVLVLFAFLLYLFWKENNRLLLMVLIVLSLFTATLFYEFAVVGPLLLIAYDMIMTKKLSLSSLTQKRHYLLLMSILPLYYILRTAARSLWFGGDYNYSLVDLPFNIGGNLFGYLLTTLAGTKALPWYHAIRDFGKANVPMVAVGLVLGVVLLGVISYFLRRFGKGLDVRMLLISLALFIIPLLPFLGFGNITTRYAYLAAFGVVLFISYLLQKVYLSLSKRNNLLAIGSLAVVIGLFTYYNVTQLQRINQDWKRAGEITNNLLLDMNYTFTQQETLPNDPVFYFVNVPIRYGNAWVFPVGLDDALWFNFRDTNFQVKQTRSFDEAFQAVSASQNVLMFEFMSDGSVTRVDKAPEVLPTDE